MNGRLYDPAVGRFLNVDPYVQMPDYTQNFNRYSYCLNNPLKFTDPDGEIVWFIVAAAAIGGGFNVASHWTEIQAAGGGWNSVWKAAGYFGVGAMAGAGAAAAPVIFPALGTGALAGLASGFAGGFITGLGNTGIGGGNFGDMLTSGMKMGGMGALTGGVIGGGSALLRGKNFWTGHEIGLGRSAFSFNNSAKFAPQRVTAPNLDAGVSNAELNIPNARTELSQSSGGRLGNSATREQINNISTELEGRGYTITGGGQRGLAEEYLKPLGGGRNGGSYIDITADHPIYGRLRVNTVDIYKNGSPTLRELNNALRIRQQIGTGEHLLLIPKR